MCRVMNSAYRISSGGLKAESREYFGPSTSNSGNSRARILPSWGAELRSTDRIKSVPSNASAYPHFLHPLFLHSCRVFVSFRVLLSFLLFLHWFWPIHLVLEGLPLPRCLIPLHPLPLLHCRLPSFPSEKSDVPGSSTFQEGMGK